MLEQQLQQLGLTKNESNVYLALFELGKSKAGEIIEHTGLHRNLVYTSLESLIRQKLVSKLIANNIAIFEANSPVSILNSLEEKKSLANEVIEQLKKKQTETPRDINVYDGLDGIKQTREMVTEQIKPGDTYYILGISDDQANKELDPFFATNNTKIINKGANIKALYDQSSSPNLLINRKLKANTQARPLPFGAKNPMWITFFQDILNMSVTGTNPVTFSIRSKEAVNGFIDYFEYFWNQKVTIESGMTTLEKTIHEMLDELKPGEEYLVLGASFGGETDDIQKLYDQFHLERIKKGVITKMLVYKESYDLIKNRFYKSGDPFYKVSFLKPFVSAPPIPMQINLFKEKMFIILYDKEPVIIKLNRKDIYEGFKKYFEYFWNQEVVVENGMEALKKVFFDMLEELKPGDEYYIIGTGLGNDPKYKDFFLDYHKSRIKKGVKVKMLAYNEQITPIINDLFIPSGDPDGKLSFIKPFVNAPAIPMQITLYKNKVRIFFSGDEPTVFYFNKPEAYHGFKKYFDALWNQETQILRGAEVVKNIWLESLGTGKLKFIGAKGYFVDRYPEMFEEILTKAQKIPNLKWQNIVDPSAKTHKLNNLAWMEAKYNVKGSKNPNVVWLWGNKVALANWTEAEPVVMISTNKTMVQSYNDYFDELWGLKD